jgi:hypothetical protein
MIALRIHPPGRKSSDECYKILKARYTPKKMLKIMEKKAPTQSYCDFVK